MGDEFKPVVYVKESCPYSQKLLDYLDHAGLNERVNIVRAASGTPTMEAVREKLASATGQMPQFPTAEVKPGEFRTESDALIAYFRDNFGGRRSAHS